jgi:hypothetical protein
MVELRGLEPLTSTLPGAGGGREQAIWQASSSVVGVVRHVIVVTVVVESTRWPRPQSPRASAVSTTCHRRGRSNGQVGGQPAELLHRWRDGYAQALDDVDSVIDEQRNGG